MIINNGIKEYIKEGERIESLFKYRYSDFKVYEIDLEGRVVGIDDTNEII
jgi:hypothetical protein